MKYFIKSKEKQGYHEFIKEHNINPLCCFHYDEERILPDVLNNIDKEGVFFVNADIYKNYIIEEEG